MMGHLESVSTTRMQLYSTVDAQAVHKNTIRPWTIMRTWMQIAVHQGCSEPRLSGVSHPSRCCHPQWSGRLRWSRSRMDPQVLLSALGEPRIGKLSPPCCCYQTRLPAPGGGHSRPWHALIPHLKLHHPWLYKKLSMREKNYTSLANIIPCGERSIGGTSTKTKFLPPALT